MAKKRKQASFRINPAGAFWLGIACFALAGAVGGRALLNENFVTAGVASGVLMLVGVGWGRLGMEKTK